MPYLWYSIFCLHSTLVTLIWVIHRKPIRIHLQSSLRDVSKPNPIYCRLSQSESPEWKDNNMKLSCRLSNWIGNSEWALSEILIPSFFTCLNNGVWWLWWMKYISNLHMRIISGCIASKDGYITWKSALCSRISSKHCLTQPKLGADVVA